MSNEDKNRYIVEEILGWCWHTWKEVTDGVSPVCTKCTSLRYYALDNPDFYTINTNQQATNFFWLWNGIKEKEWFRDFIWVNTVDLISSSALADAVVEYYAKRGKK